MHMYICMCQFASGTLKLHHNKNTANNQTLEIVMRLIIIRREREIPSSYQLYYIKRQISKQGTR